MMPAKLKNKIQRIKKFFLGSSKAFNKKVFVSFAKDKKTINAVRPIKIDWSKPTLIRKLLQQIKNTSREREPTRIGLDLKMFTFSYISLDR